MTRLILASGSESRRQMLTAAGLAFEVRTPQTDEVAIKAVMMQTGASPESVASALAVEKALAVSMSEADALVLGADQILVCEGRMFDKAPDAAAARDVLRNLRGREHHLVTAAVLVRNSDVIWSDIDTPSLWMREFSDDFLEAYLVDEAEHILSAVGCYHVEGCGAQLFERVEGDYFTIRGLPLIPLLEALRTHGVLVS